VPWAKTASFHLPFQFIIQSVTPLFDAIYFQVLKKRRKVNHKPISLIQTVVQ
jgi:hypothetical protein